LNINLNINNKNQDCKIGKMSGARGVLVERERVKEGD
jgi:hypothetical protein